MPNESISVARSGNSVVDWAVHNALFTVMARSAMIFIAIMLPILGFLVKSAWDDQRDAVKEQRDDIKKLSTEVNTVNGKLTDVRVLAVTIENLNNTMNSRFEAQTKRIDKHDLEIDDLRIRFYNMPRVTK